MTYAHLTIGQFEQDGRGDVVGQVADDAEACAGLGCRGFEIELEDVLHDNSNTVWREAGAERGGQIAIEFDGDDVASTGNE